MQGDGRAVALALRKAGTGAQPTLVAFKLNRCTEIGCSEHDRPFGLVSFSNIKHGTLPPGLYQVRIVADGAPVSIELVLPLGIDSTSLDLDREVAYELKTLSSRVWKTSDGSILAAGAYRENTSSEGVGFLGLWAVGDDHKATAYDDCYTYRKPQLPAEAVFAPGCPADDHLETAIDYNTSSRRDGSGGIVLASENDILPTGIGGWYATASEVRSSGAIALWIEF
jgi:hypothetical protein